MADRIVDERFRATRIRRGETQSELARHLGCRPEHITRIETGKETASDILIAQIAEHWNCPVEDFSAPKVRDTELAS